MNTKYPVSLIRFRTRHHKRLDEKYSVRYANVGFLTNYNVQYFNRVLLGTNLVVDLHKTLHADQLDLDVETAATDSTTTAEMRTKECPICRVVHMLQNAAKGNPGLFLCVARKWHVSPIQKQDHESSKYVIEEF